MPPAKLIQEDGRAVFAAAAAVAVEERGLLGESEAGAGALGRQFHSRQQNRDVRRGRSMPWF